MAPLRGWSGFDRGVSARTERFDHDVSGSFDHDVSEGFDNDVSESFDHDVFCGTESKVRLKGVGLWLAYGFRKLRCGG
jgi:hypothetical protein